MRLTPAQIGLQIRTSWRPRRTKKFCKTCGGTHAGHCNLVATSHGTKVRADLLPTVEARFQERLVTV